MFDATTPPEVPVPPYQHLLMRPAVRIPHFPISSRVTAASEAPRRSSRQAGGVWRSSVAVCFAPRGGGERPASANEIDGFVRRCSVGSMSRGIVLWPDPDTRATVRSLWRELATAGPPSLENHTHRPHQPHVSLVVAEHLDHEAASSAVGPDTRSSDSVPCGGSRILPRRCSVASAPFEHRVARGVWMPHMTCAYGIAPDQAAAALAIALEYLPLNGCLTTGGVEDGTTGANWPSPL